MWTVGGSIYFMLVTMSTVGYGDMKPFTPLGPVWMSFVILGSIAGFSYVTTALYDLYQQHAQGRGQYLGSPKKLKHVVVVGRPSPSTLAQLVREFYHPDHSKRS